MHPCRPARDQTQAHARAGRIVIGERTVGIGNGNYGTEEGTEKDYIKADEEYEAPKLFRSVKLWAREANVDDNELGCRDHRQFGVKFIGLLTKRRSNGKTYYRLPDNAAVTPMTLN